MLDLLAGIAITLSGGVLAMGIVPWIRGLIAYETGRV